MVEPLPLDSPRWKSLKAHFGNAAVDTELAAVPKLLERWHRAVGTYAEEYEYDPLFESYLHQLTILDVAYAVVPHLVTRLSELDRTGCRTCSTTSRPSTRYASETRRKWRRRSSSGAGSTTTTRS
jgi:hypothetical protein